jgi:hypothetical protein
LIIAWSRAILSSKRSYRHGNHQTPVRAIVELWRIGILPGEIPMHLPHIALAQVFDALSYYTEHQEEVNRYIEINHVPDHLVHPAVRARTERR